MAGPGICMYTLYLSVADITNPDLFVCGCRTWIWLDITQFYEEQCQPARGSAWLACPKTLNRVPITRGGRYRHNLSKNAMTASPLVSVYLIMYFQQFKWF